MSTVAYFHRECEFLVCPNVLYRAYVQFGLTMVILGLNVLVSRGWFECKCLILKKSSYNFGTQVIMNLYRQHGSMSPLTHP